MRNRVRGAVLAAAEQGLEAFRKLTPVTLLPLVVWVRHRIAWSRPAVRREARRQMNFLLEHTRPDADLQATACAYVKQMIWRGEVRWHPELVVAQRLEGIEHLRGARDLGRGVILSFVHHGVWDGAFPAISLAGIPPRMMIYPYMARDDAPRWVKQHLKVNSIGGGITTSTEIGTQGIIDLLGEGAVVAIASDVPGRTPVTFAGRALLGSFGAARIAMATLAPVVLLTTERDERGVVVRLHAALQPQDFDSAESLLCELLSRHEERVLAWPQATDIPMSRWRIPDLVGEGQ